MSIKIIHNAGFFSCCSVKLHQIIKFFNTQKKLPDIVDSSAQFKWYKTQNKSNDITFDYFEKYTNFNILYTSTVNYQHTHQYTNYHQLNYKMICPFIKTYFSPATEIKDMIKTMETKYSLNYDNICVLFYRGNDKNRETKICGYDEYIEKANIILNKNPQTIFLIQSDETEFLSYILKTFPNNSFHFKEEIRHMNKCKSSVDLCMSNNYIFSKYYLAITIIMSKCKHIICGSGNCSIWIMFYRGHSNNIYQNLNGTWI